MFSKLRRSGIRCAVALGLGLSASAPAQPVVAHGTPVLPVLVDNNLLAADSIQPAVDSTYSPTAQSYEAVGQGEASYYGAELAGHRTASGERFDPSELTAAHRTLPLGSKVRVTNLGNGKSVIVRINDRGPGPRSRILDMSFGAAKQIAMVRSGKAQVKLELVTYS
jgi:rare lipoprotein A